MTASKLTPKQQAFVDAYTGAARGNATEAARMAGYKGNATTLAAVGAENLRKPQIQAAIRAAGETNQKRSRFNRQRLVVWLEDVILGNEGEHLEEDPDGEMVSVAGAEMRDRIAAAKLYATVCGHLLKPDVVKARLQELKSRMTQEAYRELLLALQDE